ncbi:MAG: T9SS type A sorting domain-containing protein [Bacteroidales bacterium]|nr:T9SS type A sorting domain-containing protein [Bacteroidales bacterium]
MKRKLILVIASLLFGGIMYAQNYHWADFDYHDFNQPMIVISKVQFNGTLQNYADVEVAAFVGNELRGRSFLFEPYPNTAIGGQYFAYVPCYYNSTGETFTFKAYDHESGTEYDLCNSELIGQDDGHGTVENPVVLNFTKTEVPTFGPVYPWVSSTIYQGEGMMVTAQIRINGQFVGSTHYQVGAFCGDECRATSGNALVDWTAENLGYFAYMNVMGNNGDIINFYLFDMTSNSVVQAICSTTIELVNGNELGLDILGGDIFILDFVSEQTFSLNQGWNWWSTYIEQTGIDGLTMLETSLGHNGLTVKSQNDFTDNYYQDLGVDYWYGSLENLSNEQGYLINVSTDCDASMTGVPAKAVNHPITLFPNWNWVGYPVASAQTVTTALAGFTPSPDDVVKGQSDFTSYYEGYGWYPDDFTLVPGQSYLYCSNATANKTLTYANGSRDWETPNNGEAVQTYWKANPHAYADNFNVIAVVDVDNVEQRSETLELGAFVNGECRGSTHLRYFAPLDRYVAMLTVTGQENEQVEFRLIDTEIPGTEKTSVNRLVFNKNAIVGSLGNPYEIRFGECNVVTTNMALYPNPVEKGHEFSLDIPHDETIIEIVITDVLGAQARHETGALNAKSVKGLPTAGVYVIKVVSKSGTVYYGRIVVE